MFIFASLFEGTATNHSFQQSDAYSLPTLRRQFRKTRFFVTWATIYTLFAVLMATAIVSEWHRPLLDLLSPEDALWIQSWALPPADRVIHIVNSSYYRELLLLMTLVCYDQDADTSISMAVLLAFLPSIAISLSKYALLTLQLDGASLPSYIDIDAEVFQLANRVALLAAHGIMYLSWIKTLRAWFSEQALFQMRYSILAEKYKQDIVVASQMQQQMQQQQSSLSTTSSSSSSNSPTNVISEAPTAVVPHQKATATQQPQLSSHAQLLHLPQTSSSPGPEGSPHHSQQTKVRKLSITDSGSLPPRFPPIHRSVQNLVSGSLINLESRGQSVESTSTVSVYQQKIGTPTIIPIDYGAECFSFIGKTISLWDLNSRTVTKTFSGHAEPVSKIKAVVVPAGFNGLSKRELPGSPLTRSNLLISASWDGTIKLWDIASSKCVATLEGLMGGITCINTFDNNTKLVAGSAQGMIKLWDLKTHATIGDSYQQSPTTISAVAVWSDMSRLFAASFDGCAYIWNLATKRCEKVLRGHTKRILDAVLYDSDTRLITVSEDTLVMIWDLEKGVLLRTLEGHSSPVQVVAVYGDSQRAITGSTDGQLIAWDIYTEEIGQYIVSSLDDHTAAIISIHVFEDHLNKMYTHSMDRKLRVWDMEANVCERVIEIPPTNEHDVQRTEPAIPLEVIIAWDPSDSAAMSNITQFIQSQGHTPTSCQSMGELMNALSTSPGHYHLIFLDLSFPDLRAQDPQKLLDVLNASNAKLVLFTNAEPHLEPSNQPLNPLNTASGFMELTEKPITELSLAKMLDEVLGTFTRSSKPMGSSFSETASGTSHLPSGPSSSSTSSTSSASSSSFSFSSPSSSSSSSSSAMIKVGGERSLTTSSSGGAGGIVDHRSTTESQLHNLQERLAYVETLFAYFVPVQFFEMISPKGRDRTQLGDAVCKSVTVLFSDIRDFSTMSESMAVSELMEFLNAYLAFAMPPIQENGGFVDKFIGDSIMALFCQDGQQQAVASVNCAIAMMSHLDGLQDNGFTQVNTGIGINTGRMIIGLVGVETRMEPTVLGDAVNLASRLESLCKVYESRVIVSQYTREKLGRSVELYTMRELDLVAVKGKKLACRIYEVLEAERKEPQKAKRALLKDGLWDRALHTFRDGDWTTALSLFNQCLAIWPHDKPSKIYISRCQEAIANGVDRTHWDRAYRFQTK